MATAIALAAEILYSTVPSVAPASETISYVYDPLGRLTQVPHWGSVNNYKFSAYASDKADNRTTVTAQTATVLTAGQTMSSRNGLYMLSMQNDGNLVLYGPSGALWWTATNGGSERWMIVQSDGNLVVYDGSDQVSWNSNTSGHLGARLALQNDGNFLIYETSNNPVWSTNT